MERIQQLIDKLAEQKNNGETNAQLMMTVQLLHQELSAKQPTRITGGTSKVAVVMPGNFSYEQVDLRIQENQKKPVIEIPEEDKRFIPSDQPVVENFKSTKEIHPEPNQSKPYPSYTPPKPPTETPLIVVAEPKSLETFALFSEEREETPTLMQHRTKEKEVHEVLAEKKESLNDSLKQGKIELGNTLKEAPIKDLRNGIGVNDKFLFINELFRGDEDMYERSIKTINAFRILPEAEYWMNRELKVKLGWNDSKETVQHFYGIVRRRFS